ncbi:sugar transporter protein [Rutstroemia sp. NJR-2017a BBW]|nr:sugar transporter protein [Rutstroemia sp. NJR-2017a BBW]
MAFLPDKTRAYNWYISLVAASCMVLYGYDASVYNSVQGSKHWVAQRIGAVNTAYTVGAIVAGWFLGGPIADWLGRRWGMAIGCFITIIATFIQTFSPRGQLGCFIGGRVLIGLGQGIALIHGGTANSYALYVASGPVYIGELAPPEIRGKIMAFWQLFYSVGSFIAYWINYACQKHVKTLGEWDWKMVVIFQMLVPIIIIALLPWIPETPRWYIQHGNQVDKARASLRRVRETEQEVEDEILVIREALEFEKEVFSSSYSALWKDKSVRIRLVLAFILNVGQQLTGQGTLNTYSTAIYKKVFPSSSTIALINALNATFGIIFTLNAVWTIDRFGRKFLLIVGAAGMSICMLIVALVGTKTPNVNGSAGWDIYCALALPVYFVLQTFLGSDGVDLDCGSLFHERESAGGGHVVADAECGQFDLSAVLSYVFEESGIPFLLHRSSHFFPYPLRSLTSSHPNSANSPRPLSSKTFYFFFAVNIFLALYVWFFIPETKKVSLEEIDVLFGGSNHVEKGGDLLNVYDVHHATVGIDNIESVRMDDGLAKNGVYGERNREVTD